MRRVRAAFKRWRTWKTNHFGTPWVSDGLAYGDGRSPLSVLKRPQPAILELASGNENYGCDSERNYTGYCNTELEKRFVEQSTIAVPEKRRRLV
jgi:hypothetical protein